MTYEEIYTTIKTIADTLKVPCAYHHFEEETSPPFIAFLYPARDDFFADDSNYVKITELDIEFYTDNKDIDSEEVIESMLPFPYRKTEIYIDSEKMYETLYECEVMLNGK